MQALIAAEEGKIEKWLDNSNLANEKLDLMDTFTVDRLEDGTITPYTVAVGEKRLKPLINEVITVSRDIISKTIFKEITPEVISSIKDLNIDVKFENGEYTIGGITALELNKDEYVGIALPKANKLSKVIINASDYEGLVLEYSLNGIEWSEAETNITDGVMSSNNSIAATFVRIVNKGDNKKTIDVNKIVPDADDNYVELVTGDLEGRVDYLYDGDLSTAFEAEINKTTQSLVYKMTRITNVGNILFLQDKDNISQATVSVKNTNGVWKKVGILGKQLSDIRS